MPEPQKEYKFYNTAQQLLAGRMYGALYHDKKGILTNSDLRIPDQSVERLNEMTHQLYIAGGPAQQSRMIRDKRRTLNRALLYSYQSAFIKKVPFDNQELMGEEAEMMCRALINPDKLKMDYDDKILSVGFEHNFHPGDVFEWLNTGSFWIIRLQDLDELAYFRGEIRRCDYQIAFQDDKGNVHRTYAAIRGPVETKINYIQKHQISVDIPNYSLNIYMPKNQITLEYFRRYAKFYLQDLREGEENICWRVEAIDSISTPGILEVTAVEYYANESEDDLEAGVAGALKVQHIEPEVEETHNSIVGKTFIKPKITEEYYFDGALRQEWIYDKGLPIKVIINSNDIRRCKVKWLSNYSGQFELKYGDYSKVIVVESLF